MVSKKVEKLQKVVKAGKEMIKPTPKTTTPKKG